MNILLIKKKKYSPRDALTSNDKDPSTLRQNLTLLEIKRDCIVHVE